MKIVHIAPSAPYNEGWGYQENLLTKYQAKLGHDVTLIITCKEHSNGEIIDVAEQDYISPNGGFRVVRKREKSPRIPKIKHLFSSICVYDKLNEINPDYIFYHGLVSTTILQVVKYKKKHRNVVIVQDNHYDYNIGFNPQKGIRDKIYILYFKSLYKITNKYITKVYGVTPWRRRYVEEVFGVPHNKTELLIMGADDENMHLDKKALIREEIRKKFHISENDFLIVTGGKIDKRKKIDILMKACDNETLIVFGDVDSEIKNEFNQILAKKKNIIYIGWIDAREVYSYFYAADLVFFPGQHSVLWEQACASKVPCVFEQWEGMYHVNNGGNSEFITPVTIDSIRKKLEELHFTDKYYLMKHIAESENTDIFKYSSIALKSIVDIKGKDLVI